MEYETFSYIRLTGMTVNWKILPLGYSWSLLTQIAIKLNSPLIFVTAHNKKLTSKCLIFNHHQLKVWMKNDFKCCELWKFLCSRGFFNIQSISFSFEIMETLCYENWPSSSLSKKYASKKINENPWTLKW